MNATLRQRLQLEQSEETRQALLADNLRQQVAITAGIELVQVDAQQPLSHLGFDSLMATELRGYLLDELAVDISLETILENSTIASLVADVQTALNSSASLESVSSESVLNKSDSAPEPSRYPLSQGQWGLWFLYRLNPQSAAYNLAFTARVRSHLDMGALQRAVQILVERHPSLRTTYGQNTAEPFQEIQPVQAFNGDRLFEQVDVSQWDETLVRQRAIAAYQKPFDLESGPVLRVTVLTRSPQDHVLLLGIHHIAVDGVSFGLLLEELRQLYPALQAGESGELKPANRPNTDSNSYASFVQWQQDLVNSEVGERLWDYWQQQLKAVPTLMLPTDHTPSPNQSQQGASYSFEISPVLTTQLRVLAKSQGATLYATLLAAFQILLYRYTGQTDIVVGTPASGRSQPQFARTVGFFVNMIALRTRLDNNPTFIALLEQVRQTVLAALVHQDYPAPVLVEKLRSNRDLSQPGLFRSAFNVLNLPKLAGDFELSVSNQIGSSTDARTQWGNLELAPFEIPQQEGQNDLVFDIMETRDRLIGIFRYSSDLFDASSIHRMADHFQTLLNGIVADCNQSIAQLPFVSPSEQAQLLSWAAPTSQYPTHLCVHQLIEQQVEETPDVIAIVCPQLAEDLRSEVSYQQLTYRQLNAQANRLARYLRSHGIEQEARVGIYLARSPALLIAVLAVLKAGGVYVPLDPNYPSERLSFMLSDAQISLLLTDSSLLETLPKSNVPQHCLDRISTVFSNNNLEGHRLADHNLENAVAPKQLAYIVYTSGSTGQAKGVAVEHRSLVNAYFAWKETYQLQTLSSHLQMASFSFDVFAGDFIRALGAGSRLVVCPQDWLLEPKRLYQLMQAQGVDAAEFGPAVVRILMQYLHQTDQSLDFMRLVVVGSDAFYRQEFQQLKDLCAPGTRLINSYGVSEATIDSSCFESSSISSETAALSDEGTVPIGHPFPNTQLWVLDSHLQLVPVGTPGELYIGGAGLARGYWNRPELTKERFVPSPFLAIDSESRNLVGAVQQTDFSPILYKTGDRARYLNNGNLEYLGRNDSQVKLRGFRIELGEIEATLAQHPAVWQGVVTVRKDRLGLKTLVAYVVCKPDQSVSASALRAFLAQKLPAPMLPGGIVQLETFPLNANGKVDRRALPISDVFERGLDADSVAPRSWIEKRLAAIWMDLLHLDGVSISDNFFELGGHSLLATQAIAQLRQAFQIELPLRLLFDQPTIAQLGEHIEASCQQQIRSAPAIAPTGQSLFGKKDLPLTYAQESLWFLNQLDGIGSTYNMPMPMRLTGPLNLAALEKSLTALRERRTILRTTFPNPLSQPVQEISSESALSLSVIDLPSQQTDRKNIESLIFEEAKKLFNLSDGPLMRAVLLRCSPTDHVLVVTLHHIVADGWSIEIFARELGLFYSAFTRNQQPELPTLPIQYADFAHWQRQYLQGPVLEAMLAHWQRTLAGAPPVLSLPTDYPRPPVQTYSGSSDRFVVDAQISDGLQRLAKESKVTPFMLLLAVFQILLRGYSAQDDIVVGAPVANRNRAETAGLIGYFVNILVLRTDLSGNPSFRDLLNRVYEVAMDAYTYQDLPFEKLVEAMQPERSLSHTPLFQVMFVLQNAPAPELQLPELIIQGLELDVVTSKFDITLAMRESEQGLEGFVEYNTDLFKSETIERLMGHYQQLLKAVVANPDAPLSGLSLLTPQEKIQQQQWQQLEADYPQNLCVHQLFEAQAARTPEATAVVYGEQQLSYRQLNEHANQLGHYLREQGVGPEVRVGICLEKSPELLVAVLGVLKAGGAYVPLDPGYPSERLKYMLENAAATLVLTHSNLISILPEAATTLALETVRETIDEKRDDAQSQRLTNLDQAAQPDSLSYIVYTSGSTGKAKGVMVEHRSLANAYFAWQDAYGLERLSSHLQMASFSFDVFTGDWVRSLCSGARLVLCSKEQLLEPERLYTLMRDTAVDAAEFSPAVVRLLIQYLHQTQQRLDFMRLLVVGSDTLYVEDYRQLQALCSTQTRIINSYGVSEATIDSTYFESPPFELPSEGPVPIGCPFPHTQLHILNADLQPVPVGISGELYIGGMGVARGYASQPELTQKRFLKEKSELGKTVLYKTGDRACYCRDGAVELLGRYDHQVKLRGFRIEIGEIESILIDHPSVQAATVVLRTDLAGGEQLVAYVTQANNRQLEDSTHQLRIFAKKQLPGYMVPAYFVTLEQLPVGPNGKVDRRALPAPVQQPLIADKTFVAPSSPTEVKLAKIWADILQLPQVSVQDNFFELGGHSLLATALVFRIRQVFSVEFPLRYLFDAPTVAALSQLIEPLQPIAQSLLALSAQPRDIAALLPLSLSQQYIWQMHQSDRSGAGLNSSILVQFNGELDPEVVEHSMNKIVRHHEVLRTVFITSDTEPKQQILPALDLSIVYKDLQHFPKAQRETEAVSLGVQIGQRPFDLATAPLLRVALFRLDSQEHWLQITAHHIITDGWSFGILLQTLGRLIQADGETRSQNTFKELLPKLSIQYADFAIWQQQVYDEAAITKQLAYWQQKLVPSGSVPPPAAPAKTTPSDKVAYHYFTHFPTSLASAIATWSQAQGVTGFAVLLAGLNLALAEWSGQTETLVVATVGNRTPPATEPLIGCFINDVILRSHLSLYDSGSAFVRQLQATANEAIDHKEVPLQRVIEQTKRHRSLNLLASLTMTPSIQPSETSKTTSGTTSKWEPVNLQARAADWENIPSELYTIGATETTPLEVYAELSTTVRLVVSYSAECFSRSAVEHLFERYQTLITTLIANPDNVLATYSTQLAALAEDTG